ncbi:MAG: hypothetical protein N0E54_00170, partial [Candidatus Thiodiazotropha taylori]|nr:hypothetical protein [Candidatus Thiodiazotropha endolucinida]MCW4227132.1 hypothetical protein [Candidatus Thiodiazotropha taylori]
CKQEQNNESREYLHIEIAIQARRTDSKSSVYRLLITTPSLIIMKTLDSKPATLLGSVHRIHHDQNCNHREDYSKQHPFNQTKIVGTHNQQNRECSKQHQSSE